MNGGRQNNNNASPKSNRNDQPVQIPPQLERQFTTHISLLKNGQPIAREPTRVLWRTLGKIYAPPALPAGNEPGLALAPVWAKWLTASSTLGLGVLSPWVDSGPVFQARNGWSPRCGRKPTTCHGAPLEAYKLPPCEVRTPPTNPFPCTVSESARPLLDLRFVEQLQSSETAGIVLQISALRSTL